MTDPATISAFLTSLTFATKFVKASLEKIKDMAVREKVEELLNAIIPLQSHIIALQEANFACIKEKQNLENKLREVEKWAKELESYELNEPVSGTFVYIKKPESGHTGPVVYLCPKCFDADHKKSILQVDRGGYHYCLNCKNYFYF
jgi:hypothetical protein